MDEPEIPPPQPLPYRASRDDFQRSDPGARYSTKSFGCTMSLAAFVLLVFVTCAGNGTNNKYLNVEWIAAGALLLGTGLFIGLRVRQWGFLIGVFISLLIAAGLFGLIFAICSNIHI